MQKKMAFRAASVDVPASTSGSYGVQNDNDPSSQRYPSRFRSPVEPATSAVHNSGGKAATASAKRAEVHLQHLKSQNVDLTAKLRLKTAENSQLKLDLARLKAEHERELRQVQLQQKKSVEMMARTLKHAEDLIKEKEVVIGKQQGLLVKMSSSSSAGSGTVRGTATPGITRKLSAPPVLRQSFHGRTEASRKALVASGGGGPMASSNTSTFTRSASLRSQRNTPPAYSKPSSGMWRTENRGDEVKNCCFLHQIYVNIDWSSSLQVYLSFCIRIYFQNSCLLWTYPYNGDEEDISSRNGTRVLDWLAWLIDWLLV